MSITDELREWASVEVPYKYGHQLLAIADRIDAEHEAAIQQVLMGEGGVPATDENMAEHGWIRLPKDADGEYIHIGDVLTDDAEFKSEGVVECLMLDESGWFVGFGKGWTDTKIHEWHHHHAPTVEDVLREFANRVCNSGHQWGLDAADTIAEYAKRLKLAEGEDA